MTLAMIKKEEFEAGREQEREAGIVNSIELMLSVGLDEEDAVAKVAAKYEMPVDEVRLLWLGRKE